MLDSALLAILRCPRCRGVLAEQTTNGGDTTALICQACRLRYAIEDGIPNLLLDEAQPFPANTAGN